MCKQKQSYGNIVTLIVPCRINGYTKEKERRNISSKERTQECSVCFKLFYHSSSSKSSSSSHSSSSTSSSSSIIRSTSECFQCVLKASLKSLRIVIRQLSRMESEC